MPSPRPSAWSALLITLAIQALVSAALIAPTTVAPVIRAQLGLSAAAVGVYISCVYLGAMLASLLGGHFVGHHGPIRISQFGLLACAAGLGLIASGWPALAALGAFAVGLGYGPITPASSQILARTAPPGRLGLVFSIKQTGVPLGGVLAGAMVPPLTLASSWPAALGVIALAALACAALAQRLRAALDDQRTPSAGTPGPAVLLGPIRMVWANRRLRTIAGCSFVFSMVQVCLTAYTVSWLTADLGWALVTAGLALSVSQAGGVAGRVLWGWFADHGPGARRTLIGLAALMMACGLLAATLGPHSPPALVLTLLAVYGATGIGWNGVYLAEVARIAPPGQAGVATGGTLAFTFFGVLLGPPLFGVLAAAAHHHGPAFAALALPLALCLLVLWRLGR